MRNLWTQRGIESKPEKFKLNRAAPWRFSTVSIGVVLLELYRAVCYFWYATFQHCAVIAYKHLHKPIFVVCSMPLHCMFDISLVVVFKPWKPTTNQGFPPPTTPPPRHSAVKHWPAYHWLYFESLLTVIILTVHVEWALYFRVAHPSRLCFQGLHVS